MREGKLLLSILKSIRVSLALIHPPVRVFHVPVKATTSSVEMYEEHFVNSDLGAIKLYRCKDTFDEVLKEEEIHLFSFILMQRLSKEK